MTYINAFKCAEGIFMSADTEEDWGDYKNYVEKIAIVEDRSYPLAIGGAGIGDLIDAMLQEVTEKASTRKPATAVELQAMLRECIEIVYNLDLPWLAVKKAERTPMFLVAAKPANEDFCLFRIVGKRLKSENKKRDSIGYGTPAIDALFRRLHRDSLPMHQGFMLAVYLMSQAKKYGEGVGGPTNIVAVMGSGAWREYQPYIDHAEQRVEEFLKLTDGLFLCSVDSSIRPSAFPAILNQFSQQIAALRQSYLDQTSSISLSRVFSDPTYCGEPYTKIFPGAIVDLHETGAVNAREETPEEKERNRQIFQAMRESHNQLAAKQLAEMIAGRQPLYLGEEVIQVRGTAGPVEDSPSSSSVG
jgi:hypothetical protein